MAPSDSSSKRLVRKTTALADPHPADLLVLDHIPDIVARFDQQHRFTFINRAGLASTGQAREAFIGCTPRQAGLAQDFARSLEEHISGVLGSGQASAFTHWHEGPLGRRLFHTQALPDPGPHGLQTVLLISRDITSIQQASEKASQSAARFTAFLENLPACAWITDEDGILTHCNREYAAVFHRPASELIGQPISSFAPPDITRKWQENNRLVLESRRPHQSIEKALRRDGTEGEFLVYKFPLEEGGRRLVGGTAVDLTEQRSIQGRLEQLNRLYAVSNAINEAIVRSEDIPSLHQSACRIAVDLGGLRLAWIGLLSPDDPFLTASARWGDDSGYVDSVLQRAEEVLMGQGPAGRALRSGQPAVSNTITDDAHFVLQAEAQDRGFQACGAFPLIRRGQVRGVLLVYAAQTGFFQDEEIRVLQNMADDLALAAEHAEIEQMELEARQVIRLQAEGLNQASEAIRITDLEGRVLHWNRTAESLYQLPLDQARGERITQILPENQAILAEAREATLATGHWTGEIVLHRPHSDRRTLESRWTLLHAEDGKPQGILVIDSDITEKKKLEAQFLRTQRLESIGILAGGIAHDLNNILAPILMSLQMLRESSPSPEAARLIETVHQSAIRGAELVRQILTYSRGLETPRLPVPPKDLLHELTLLIRDTFPKNISTTFECAPGTLPVKGDRTQLSQMLLNLCVNARDAMPSGGLLSVRASTRTPTPDELARHPGASPSPHTVFEVIDTGSGIPLEIQPRIFEHFFTTKEPGKGTGLGLPTTMTIVTGHQGFLELRSTPGRGTTFCIFLPAAAATAAPSSPLTRLAPHRGKGETILVVDDESSLRSITRQVLQACGYQVLEAPSGEAALRIFREQGAAIHLLLTDMMMPGMSGADLVRAIHRLRPELPVIAVSGLSDATPSEFAGLQVHHFLGKPYTSEELLTALREALEPKVA